MLKMAGTEIKNGNGHEEAYALLRTLWWEEMKRPFPQIARTERGKPYFIEENIHFSITHTKKNVFCVMADVPVGIDAEEMDRKVNPALAEKILSPEEYAQYLEANDPNRALLTFWVLKEAAAKSTGEGLHGYPNQTKFSLKDSRVREWNGCLVAVIKETDRDAF